MAWITQLAAQRARGYAPKASHLFPRNSKNVGAPLANMSARPVLHGWQTNALRSVPTPCQTL